jgi:hypothetical protein
VGSAGVAVVEAPGAPTLAGMADPIELLDRHHQRLHERNGTEFVRELRPFYDFITAGPAPVAEALAELRERRQGLSGRSRSTTAS